MSQNIQADWAGPKHSVGSVMAWACMAASGLALITNLY